MLTLDVLICTLAIAPSLISAELFLPGSGVEKLTKESFNQVMKETRTSVVAFVVPGNSHQAMADAYSRVARELKPSILLYAVDCKENTDLCGTQTIKSYPTIKAFPRGSEKIPVLYKSTDMSSNAIHEWIKARVPDYIEVISYQVKATDITSKAISSKVRALDNWVTEHQSQDRAVLFTEYYNVIPLYWKALGNKYNGRLRLAFFRDDGARVRDRKVGKRPITPTVFLYSKDYAQPRAISVDTRTKEYDALTKAFDLVLSSEHTAVKS